MRIYKNKYRNIAYQNYNISNTDVKAIGSNIWDISSEKLSNLGQSEKNSNQFFNSNKIFKLKKFSKYFFMYSSSFCFCSLGRI